MFLSWVKRDLKDSNHKSVCYKVECVEHVKIGDKKKKKENMLRYECSLENKKHTNPRHTFCNQAIYDWLHIYIHATFIL